jgi:hypothetical protein
VESAAKPRAERVIGAFQSRGRPIVLSAHRPSPEAYIVALQAFFRRERVELGAC